MGASLPDARQWMRQGTALGVLEVFVHAVDLAAGVSFAELPVSFLAALLQ
jgi:hypothetical protein